jgi:hypothetical protein
MVRGKWKRGHHSRIQNISKREDIREKRRQVFHRLHGEGKLPTWNKGLTKETDSRVSAYARKSSEGWDEERRKNASELLSRGRRDGTVPTVTIGPDHWNWKGGITKLYTPIQRKLYNVWKRPILERDAWRCRDCGVGGSLHVHHDDVRFSAIYHEVVDPYLEIRGTEEELSFEEKERLVERIVRIHVDREVSGISLCPPCHRARHSDSQDDDLDQEADQ